MLWVLALILFFAIINRARGTTSWMGKNEEIGDTKGWLPGRPLYYVSAVVAVLASLVLPWDYLSFTVFRTYVTPTLPYAGVAFGVAYLIWGSLAWGRWFDLGRLPDGYGREGKDPNLYERAIMVASGGSDHAALFWRHCLVVPGLIVTGYLLGDWRMGLIGIPFAAVIVAAYELAWRLRPRNPIWLAEVVTGGLWGLLLVSLGAWASA